MYFKHPRSFNLSSLKLFLVVISVLSLAASKNAVSQTGQSPFPRQMAWTAYNLGSTGYNQAVAIGAMLREQFGVTCE